MRHPVAGGCAWDERWAPAVAERGRLDVALVYFGTWDVLDQRVGTLGGEWAHLGEPAFDAWLLAERASTSGPGVHVLDLAAWLVGTGELSRLLPDAVHVTWQDGGGTAREIGDRYLVPEILRLAAT